MIYLKLFLTFFEIGAVSFGGGYGMIPLIQQKVMANNWLTEEEFLNLIAVSESTPGPIAINMATFIGSTQGGLLGSLSATFGAILPSFALVLIISAAIKNFFKYRAVRAFLDGVKPCITGLICATALVMLFSNLFGIKTFGSIFSPDLFNILIFLSLVLISLIYFKIRKKSPSPILMIVISAALGIFFGIIEEIR